MADLPAHRDSREDLARRFLEGTNCENTRRGYRRDLEYFRSWLRELGHGAVEDLDDVAQLLVEAGRGHANMLVLEWKADMMKSGLAPSTVNRRLSAVRSLVRMAGRADLVEWTLDVPNVPSEKYRDTAGPGEKACDELLSALSGDTSKKGRRDQAILVLLYERALRRHEVVGLNLSDVDLGKKRLRIRGKGRLEHEWVTVSEDACYVLKNWIEVRGRKPGPLFVRLDPGGNGERLTGRSVHKIVSKLGKKAGLKVWPHGLRHTAITVTLDSTGGDVRSAQRFSRHKRIDTLLQYDDNREDLGGKLSQLVSDRRRRPPPRSP